MNFTTTMIALAALGSAGSAIAQDAAPEETPAVTFTGTAAFVTDYRFRGVSLSDRDIAGQASITATSSFGLFASIWGSTIEPIGATATSNGAEQEIDLTVGFSKTFGNITPTVGVVGYFYPGGKDVAYYETFAALASTLGPVALTVGFNYAPDQENTATDNSYVYGLVSVGIPDSPITLKASVGYEDGFFDYGSGGKVDYMVGVDAKYKFLTLGLQYIGNDLDRAVTGGSGTTLGHNAKDGIVVSLTASF